MRLYLGNIPFTIDETGLRALFGDRGAQITEVRIIVDRASGRPRGFAFVELPDEVGRTAILELHGSQLGGRTIVVSEAQQRAGTTQGRRQSSGSRGG